MNAVSIKENKTIGIVATLLLHILILLLCWFFGFQQPNPPLQPVGTQVMVYLGMEDFGMGNDYAPTPSETPQENEIENEEKVVPVTNVPTTQTTEDVTTQDDVSPVNINKTVEKETEKKMESEEIKEEQKVNEHLQQLLNRFPEAAKKNSGGSRGNTGKPGLQGNENGGDGGPDGGPLPGGGGGYSLKGRSVLSVPKISTDTQEEGTVVVTIKVDKNGVVFAADPGAPGTTTTNSILLKKAKQAALKSTFSKNPSAPDVQIGQMTFVFLLQ